jgi:hypothetical protein
VNRAVRNALREILAFDELHHEGVRASGLLEPVNRGDVRMVQRRERLRFPLKAREALGVLREGVWQDLDRHLAAEARVRRAIHRAHAAFADLGRDFVDAETGAGCEGQTVGV